MSKLCINDDEASKKLQQNERSKGSNTKVGRVKRRSKGEVVDLRSLLIQCAQAVAGNDQRASTELLKLIRQHSSPMGDGSQRLAHFFANGLEARLVGLGMKIYEEYKAPAIERPLAADIIRAYKVYASACPSKRMSYFFANWMIGKVAEKATRLHIIDFGILFGFQWPSFIQHLSQRPGRPPRLRITGIDFPQPAEKWENIRLEDLKIDKDEKLVVNSLYRLKNLLDETVVEDCPRDAVLNLIRRINPEIFIHGIVNGSFNGPSSYLGLRRHSTSMMHYLTCLMLLYHEKIKIGCCLRKWYMEGGFQAASFRPGDLVQSENTVKQGFRKNFMVEEDGGWMLQGWKGRTIHALSCWKPC
ncbi:Scarecrow-like protein 14 [Vitis vinifera]|uniref:Scarecrow-like protein 14 n=1 Tax=Vitis vinifera TaxID=29760 RepID=A0A438G1E5_VITVI|nr:Scarecrow-like protein 14 [Vitis vinifera]